MPTSVIGAVEQELQGERASALGEAGRRIEATLAALAEGTDRRGLEVLIDEAATAIWYFIILRESLRWFDHREALNSYAVPARVMARVGVVKQR
ncbi:hypothetical protein BH11MYX1_BH11MYX1_24820 [soil metagenome]